LKHREGFFILVLNLGKSIQKEIDDIYLEFSETLPLIEELAPKYVKIYKELYKPVSVEKEIEDMEGFKQIYREISRETHPDKVSGHEEQFKRASVAYKEKDDVSLLEIYEELGHSTDFTINIASLEKELKELKNSERYQWVYWYKEGKVDEVREAFLRFLLNEIYKMETEDDM